MSQLGFFDSGARVVLDDDSGSIRYIPGALGAREAAQLFDRLLQIVPWRSERRTMYEREVEVPRLVAAMRIADVDIPELRDAAALVERVAGATFNSIGLNLYRDGRDSVAPHNDTRSDIAPGQPVALLSLGATRRMTIRSKALPRRVFDMDLEPGSVLVMSYRTQQTYDHGIPKTGAAIGPRISAAFRVRLG